VVFLALLTVPVLVRGADIGVDLRAGYINSDNVAQTPVGNGSSIYEAGGRFQAGIATPSLDLEVDSDIRYRQYSNSLYGSDFLPRARAGAVYTVAENTLYLTVQENLGQIALTSEQGLQPSDRQNLNVFTIGPDYFQEFSDLARLHVSGRYSRIDYSQSDQDGSRVRGEVSLDRDLTNAITTSVGVFGTHASFSNDALPSNDTKGITVGLSGETPRTQVQAIVGVQQLRDVGQTNTGLYGDLELSRLLSRRSRVTFSAISRFGDSSDAYIFGQAFTSAFENTVSVQVRPQPVRQQGVGVSYNFTGPRLTTSIGGHWFRERGISGDNTDRSLRDAYVSAEYRLTPIFLLGASALHDGQNAPGLLADRHNDDSIGVEFKWRTTANLQVSVRTDYFDRTGSTTDFHEWRYSAFLSWVVEKRKAPDTLFRRRPVNRRLRDQVSF
jgi:hypothetical protein